MKILDKWRLYRQRHEAEVERRTLVRHYEYLSRYAHDMIFLLDEKARILEANDRAVAAYGYAKEELLGMEVRDLCAPAQRDMFHLSWDAVQQQKDLVYETEHRRKDGSTFPVEISMRLIDAGGGSFRQAIVRDISERETMEKNLRKSEQRFLQVVEGTPDGIFVQTGGCFRYLNPAALSLLGAVRQDQLIGQPVWDRRHPDDHGMITERIRLLDETREPVTAHQHKCLRLDGTAFDVESSAVPITFEGQEGAVVFFRDITERKRTVEALRKSEKRYRQIIETTQEGVLIVDQHGKIAYLNHRLASMLGFSQGEMLERPVFDFVPPALHDRQCRFLQRRLEGLSDQYDFTFQRKDGSILHVNVSANPLLDENGNYEGALSMLTDVTARRQLQEQLNQAQKMQAVGRLAGGVAHDFNNLLTIVTGYGQMLQESFPQDDERWECARAILNAAERSARLTRQLLNLSRQELPSPSVTHVNTVIGELNSMLRRVLGEEVVLTEMLRPDLWNSRIHRAQIEQILLNLIVNARDAMPKGGTILLETDSLQLNETDLEQHPALRPGRYVMIGVSDTGSGMDEQLMAHLFEPFFTTKSRDQGAGLGLSVVYGIVQQAGGEIQVDSVPGVGSTFRVYLPATESDVTEEAPAPVAAQPAREGETILLVEDDPEVLALVRTRLTSLNYAVLEASSAQEAVHLVENHPDRIHLLLTDVVMPKTKGPDLARELLVRRPHIRVIYMSGYPDHSAVTEDLAKPGFRFLPKPFTREDLARVIRESLDGPSPQASVLIADDDADVRATFRLVLRGGGYAVDEADSGRAAMQRLSERHFDLLLTDLVMPDYNGIELIRMVRQKYPSLKVIATSGALSEMLGVASYLGADAALPKPIRPETLLSTLAKVLG